MPPLNPFWWLEFNATLTLLFVRRLRNAAAVARWDAMPKGEVIEFKRRGSA
jgi:hypothetical protein